MPRHSISVVSSRARRRPEIEVSGDRREAFARRVIDDVEHAKPPSVSELTGTRAPILVNAKALPAGRWILFVTKSK
ncbi:hypothetical protein AMC87_PC00002 (plasmid) [Rhizobium phaseoli]|nr:hypothetical protein IE4803_PB00002 [Rhizobium etli bv. phaseoli str. IE4803]ANL49706.1 hypothetical protein AMC87_PC00002 [Rhizobium phaseoli]